MEWEKNLRVGTSVKNSKRLKFQIIHRQIHPTVYLIACDRAAGGRLVILPSTILLQKEYPTEALYIVGMAGYKREAYEITASLIEDAYRVNQDYDVYRHLTGRGQMVC